MTLALTKNTSLWFYFSKENILKLISFIATFAIFSFFVFAFNTQLQSNSFILSWKDIFNTETITNKSHNFLGLGTFIIFAVVSLASLFKSFSILNNNNLKFKHYIYWYVNYLVLAIVATLLNWFLPHKVSSQPIHLLYKALIVLWYLFVSLGYQIHALVFRAKHLINIRRSVVLSSLEYFFKVLLIGGFLLVLYLFVHKITDNDALYFNNDVLNYLDDLKSNNKALYFVYILLILLFVISLLIVEFLSAKNQKESIVASKNKISSFLAFIGAILIGIFAFSIYLIFIKNPFLENALDFEKEINLVYLIILAIGLFIILSLIAFKNLIFVKGLKATKQNAVKLVINFNLVILSLMSLLNLLKVNYYSQQFSNLIILFASLVILMMLVVNKHVVDKLTFINYAIVLLLIIGTSFINCFEYTSVNFRNNSLVYSSSSIIYSARIAIGASILLFLEILRKSSKKIFSLMLVLGNLKLVKAYKE
ncbi:Uncharacterised protein [Mycoplasmopsis citelli]|uniref:Uncharacterized protein n=1 Tax=Mycoplasmopsis citelli TaxID=171281 RepID=A0A449B2Y9_9BACT|nr:hypothetical protein [Mycoplasmopsis citelli]VEU74967.1 Uncharacterised protein [Mycoplasmopsis citelli]